MTGIRESTSMPNVRLVGGTVVGGHTDGELTAERIAWHRTVIAFVGVAATFIGANAVAVGTDRLHWWANFILLPGAVLTAIGFALPRRNAVRFLLGWLGAIVLTTAILLMFGVMGTGWPLMIVVPCLGPLALYAVRPADPSVRALVHTVAGLGGLAVALGWVFFGFTLDVFDAGRSRWWVWFMLAAGAVPIVNGLALVGRRRGEYWFSTAVLLVALGGFTIIAALREYGR